MRSLIAGAALFLAAGQAGAATLVVDLYDTADAESPFEEIRCGGPACGEDGLMPLDGVLTPVAYAVKVDPAGRLSIEMARGPSIRYGLRRADGKTLDLSEAKQATQLVRLRSKEGRDGLKDDLVVRKDADVSEVWVTARIER